VFDLLECLDSAADLFDRYGGHRLAAGCSLAETKLDELRPRLNAFARERLRPADLEPTLLVDAEIRLSEITKEWLEAVWLLQPFGSGNPAPRFAAHSLRVISAARLFNDKHAVIRVSDGEREMEAVGWNMASQLASLEPGCSVAIAFEVEKSDFSRRDPFRLIIRDVHR
jgi:single-stranded-DNA-specific exonuclease